MGAPTPLWTSLPTLARRLRRASSLAVGSDLDGTLAEIVDHSDHAVLPPRTRVALATLAAEPDVRVGFFSGRTLEDLVERVGVEPAWYSGVCGLEARDSRGARQDPEVAGGGVPESLLSGLRAWCESHPGTWVQDKGRAVAVHYRQLPARLQAAFTAGVRRRLHEHRDEVKALPGKKVFEIAPAEAVDKGWSLGHWLAAEQGPPRESTPPPCVVYLGDDVNDESAYPFVRGRRGISVAVARRSSAAEFRLDSPTEVCWFLEWLEREWRWLTDERGARALR